MMQVKCYSKSASSACFDEMWNKSILTFEGVGKATILKKLELFSDLLDVGDTNTSIDDVVDSASL